MHTARVAVFDLWLPILVGVDTPLPIAGLDGMLDVAIFVELSGNDTDR